MGSDNGKRPGWMPEIRQFSQADPHIVQRPEGISGPGDEAAKLTDIQQRVVERYSELQVTPGRWDEAYPLPSAPQVVSGGQTILIEKDLGFDVNSFLCDNWSNQWLYEPNLRRFIPPYSGGWVIAVPNGYQKARIELRAPQAFAQAVAIASEFVWVAWHEAYLPPMTGILLPGGAPGLGSVIWAFDNVNVNTQGVATSSLGFLYDGGGGNSVDRMKSASATNLGAALGGSDGAALTDTPGEWSIFANPGANVVASVTRAAIGGIRHIARNLAGDVATNAAPAVGAQDVVLRDGASGIGAFLWYRAVSLSAVAGISDHVASGPLNIVGTAGNAMTIEFIAALGAGTFERVSLSGFDAAA